MEAFEQAQKDAMKAVSDAQRQVDEGIKVAAEYLVAGANIVNSAYNDAVQTSTDLADQGKVGL
jgi:hypothetical protein